MQEGPEDDPGCPPLFVLPSEDVGDSRRNGILAIGSSAHQNGADDTRCVQAFSACMSLLGKQSTDLCLEVVVATEL